MRAFLIVSSLLCPWVDEKRLAAFEDVPELPARLEFVPEKQSLFRLPPGIRRIEGTCLPLPEERAAPTTAELKATLSERDGAVMPGTRFRFRTVADNPALPGASIARKVTAVFVAGNPVRTIDGRKLSEREDWAVSARDTYGTGVYIYNDAYGVKDLADRLAKFPPRSVRTLIIGGNSETSGGGVFMGYDALPFATARPGRGFVLPRGCENINIENLTAGRNRKRLEIIRERLSDDATVQIQACLAADSLDNLARYARAFQSRVIASQGTVGDWGEAEHRSWLWHEKPREPKPRE